MRLPGELLRISFLTRERTVAEYTKLKIVYGVSGEGSGHSSRAKEIASHLVDAGHDLWLVSYDRGYRNLKDDFRVFETEGLRIACSDNRVSIVRTFTENLKRLHAGVGKLEEVRQQMFEDFQPDCVITDFEPMTAYLATHFDLPLITIDNQHRMRYMRYDCPRDLVVESRVTKTIIRLMIPQPDVSLVTTFFIGETRNARTYLFPPILRSEVIVKAPTHGEHILVYLTSGYESLLDELKSFPRESFRVYGYDKQLQDANLEFRPFSKTGFLDDLAASRAVIATAGFTLMSEALYLGKPYLALPMQGQFEQQLNGYQLGQLSFGKSCDEVDAEKIGDFLYRLPEYREKLSEYPRQGNEAILAKLDDLLDEEGKQLRWFHHHRNEL